MLVPAKQAGQRMMIVVGPRASSMWTWGCADAAGGVDRGGHLHGYEAWQALCFWYSAEGDGDGDGALALGSHKDHPARPWSPNAYACRHSSHWPALLTRLTRQAARRLD